MPAKALRARAARAADRAAQPGSPRARFVRDRKRRLAVRLIPTLGVFALAAGAAAVGDVLFPSPDVALASVIRTTSLAESYTAIALAALTLMAAIGRRRVVVLHTVAVLGAIAHIVGWSVVQDATGGARSPYALAAPFGVAMIMVLVPLPWQLALLVTGAGALATVLAAPSLPLPAFVVFAMLFAGSVVLARQRRRRELGAFRRAQRIAGAVAKLRRMQDELVVVEKLEALRVLVGGMAHELNNALTVSTSYVERIRQVADEDPVATRDAADRVSSSLDRIRKTIDRLHRFAMAEDQVLEPADVCALVDFALESAVGRARAGIIVDRAYDEGLGPVACHVATLAEALVQVARNAVEAMPGGGTVHVRVRRDGGHVLVSVTDEGQGIPKERLARVFDPFFARDEAETLTGSRVLPPMPGRSGLGLSAVYGIVRAIDGEVRIESEVGKGTCVTIALPVSS